jgi:hypothetical protein
MPSLRPDRIRAEFGEQPNGDPSFAFTVVARESGIEINGQVAGPRRRGAAAFAAHSGRKPYGATSCRARLPGTGPRAVPAVPPRCRVCTAVRPSSLAPGVLAPGGESQSGLPECRAWYEAAPPGSTVLRIAFRATRAVDPGVSAAPAGLTARARPKARPRSTRQTSTTEDPNLRRRLRARR